jgi:hypothetical protein
MNTEKFRRTWNIQQKELRRLLSTKENSTSTTQLFMSQHAALHTSSIVQPALWSYADEVLKDLSEDQLRYIPDSMEHSIAWLIWHIARIEDVTMNMLVSGRPQLMHQKNWSEKMKIQFQDTGNAMSADNIALLSDSIDIQKLQAYRLAVGFRTREIVKQLQPAELKNKVQRSRLQQVLDEGAVIQAASDLIEYWGK